MTAQVPPMLWPARTTLPMSTRPCSGELAFEAAAEA